MIKYQIRFCDSKGHGSFAYIDVKSKRGVEKKAANKATEYIIERTIATRTPVNMGSFSPFPVFQNHKPMKTVNVWEWDNEKRAPKKGGHRFKIRLSYFEATYTDGSKERKEWYEPVI